MRSPAGGSLDNEPREHREEPTVTSRTTQLTTHTLEVPGATLTYDVRPTDSPAPVLFLIGSPMGAGGFGTLASHFPDRTIVTYDPRGVERSIKTDPASPSTPEQHGDDVPPHVDRILLPDLLTEVLDLALLEEIERRIEVLQIHHLGDRRVDRWRGLLNRLRTLLATAEAGLVDRRGLIR